MRDLVLTQIDGISPRALNCCTEAGILTIGDLFEFIKNKSLSTIKNCGIKTAQELYRVMSRYEDQFLGYQYDLFSIDNDVAAAEPAYEYSATTSRIADKDTLRSLNAIFHECLNRYPTQIIDKIKIAYRDANTLLCDVLYAQDAVFARKEGWNIKEHFRFWDFCLSTLDTMARSIDIASNPNLHARLVDTVKYIDSTMRLQRLHFVRDRLRALLITSDLND